MKKGDIRKQEYIQIAETLFCQNGYEATSVQDILDVMHASKGSFYHHFASKEALLQSICVVRSEALAAEAMARKLNNETPLDSINRLLSGMIPLSGDRQRFLLMLLPVFDLPEGWSVQRAYCQALVKAFEKPMTEAIAEGNRLRETFSLQPELDAVLCLSLANDLWGRISESILAAEHHDTTLDLGEALQLIEQYRITMEKILLAPFGSISLISLPELRGLADQIHRQLEKPFRSESKKVK